MPLGHDRRGHQLQASSGFISRSYSVSATGLFTATPSVADGGTFRQKMPYFMERVEDVFDDQSRKLDELDMNYVIKDTIYIQGEFRYHPKRQDEMSE